MEGTFYYWIAWMAWVYTTFFMKKTNKRIMIGIIILLTIIFASHHITLFSANINISLLLLLFYCYKEISNGTFLKLLYFFICTFTISLAYSSFLLFELYDPVWLFFDRNWMLALVLIYISVFLFKDLRVRLLGLLIGSIHGEILFGACLNKINFEYLIGSFVFFDVISISFSLVFIWSHLEELFHHFDESIQKKQRRNMAK